MELLDRDGGVVEYASHGAGEPVLLIHPSVTADGLSAPLMEQPELAASYQIITYRRRGYGATSVGAEPVTMADQAADAAAVLDHLGVGPAHVVGHSFGGVVALQLAHDRPELVHSLALLEPPLMGVPSGPALRDGTLLPALQRYRSGDRQEALDLFLTEVFGPDWRAAVEKAIPGGVAAAEAAADAFFGVDLLCLQGWALGDGLAGSLRQPILSVVGTESPPFRFEGRRLLHRWFPHTEDFDVAAANHLLQIKNPEAVARGLGRFLGRHPIERKGGR
jgi:pimeloyl-ACP methyl ester carboxylesterase